MTLEELELIEAVLTNYLNSESCAETMNTDDTDLALRTIQREIKLKKMDPRKTQCEIDHAVISKERTKKGFRPMPCPDCGELI